MSRRTWRRPSFGSRARRTRSRASSRLRTAESVVGGMPSIGGERRRRRVVPEGERAHDGELGSGEPRARHDLADHGADELRDHERLQEEPGPERSVAHLTIIRSRRNILRNRRTSDRCRLSHSHSSPRPRSRCPPSSRRSRPGRSRAPRPRTGGTSTSTTTAAVSIARIDPRTNAVVKRAPVGSGPCGVVGGAGSLWVENYNDNTIARVDPATLKVVKAIRVGAAALGRDVRVRLGLVVELRRRHGLPPRPGHEPGREDDQDARQP